MTTPAPAMAVFDVTHYGAVMDGATDDAAALNAAIAEAAGVGAVYIPAGTLAVGSDIDIPENTIIQGAGVQNTTIKRIGSEVAAGVLTSNLTGTEQFSRGIGLYDFQVDVNGFAVGGEFRGLNENCRFVDVGFRKASQVCLHILGVSQPATYTSHQARFIGLKLGPNSGATALRLEDCKRLKFENLTVDIPAGLRQPIGKGIEMVDAVVGCVFENSHIENCTVGIEMGTDGACFGNIFTSTDFGAPEVTPAKSRVGNIRGSMNIIVRNARHYIFDGLRDGRGYDYVLVDDMKGRTIAGKGDGRSKTSIMWVRSSFVSGRNGGDIWWVAGDVAEACLEVNGADITAKGGFRQTIDGWYQSRVDAGQSSQPLNRHDGTVDTTWIAPRGGSITCVCAKTDQPRAGGSATVTVFRNGEPTSASAVLDAVHDTFASTELNKDAEPFQAGDELEIRLTTHAAWAPAGALIRASLEVET